MQQQTWTNASSNTCCCSSDTTTTSTRLDVVNLISQLIWLGSFLVLYSLLLYTDLCSSSRTMRRFMCRLQHVERSFKSATMSSVIRPAVGRSCESWSWLYSLIMSQIFQSKSTTSVICVSLLMLINDHIFMFFPVCRHIWDSPCCSCKHMSCANVFPYI